MVLSAIPDSFFGSDTKHSFMPVMTTMRFPVVLPSRDSDCRLFVNLYDWGKSTNDVFFALSRHEPEQ
jgi:hypothetical protein